MLEIQAKYRRHNFHLDIDVQIDSPWAVIFGPSGSGKTTLLRILAGLIHLEEGCIRMDGHVLADASKRFHLRAGHRNIGLVTQQPALFPHMTAHENVGYGLRNMTRLEREAQVESVLELVQADALRDRPARQLSGGEAQRVALARALAPKPKLLLLDEPFSALDSRLRHTILNDLSRWLAEHKIPAIAVTHTIVEAFQTQAEVLIFQEGRVVAQGPSEKVLASERERLMEILSSSRQRPALAQE